LHVPRFVAGTYLDTIRFETAPLLPGGLLRDEWAFEIRFHKSVRLDDEIIILPGFIELIGTL
jgi:hypothetical protein